MINENYILGIDTGGTFTDSVILAADRKTVVCSSKALTTKEDLRIGIQKSIENLTFTDFCAINQVSLSTTLATNAIVEGKGCKTGLILIGKELKEKLPAEICYFVRGKVDITGNILETINEQEILQIAGQLNEKVEAVAISCYASIRNPKLEVAVKKMIEEAIDKPIFCAHELTGSLGFFDRTVTSVLNARLVKIIEDFILSTKEVLIARGITVPVMVVKGDGSLMHENVAMQRPIETILSGPAASTIGSCHLTGSSDAFIIDMGGTTTDIINITDGTAKICTEGAVVGGWRTKVKAADVCTYGLGGDSLISLDHRTGVISVGPEKVEPLCVTSTICPSAKQELSCIDKRLNTESICLYRRGRQSADMLLSKEERELLQVLKGNAYTSATIANLLDKEENCELPELAGLVKRGAIIKCSVTPTDLLHALGRYTAFDCTASKIGLELTAALDSYELSDFLDAAIRQISKQLYLFCLQSAAIFEERNFDFQKDEASMFLLDKAFNSDPDEFLWAEFFLNKPIVGVGAPAHAWLPDVANRLKVPIIIPDYAEVTSAVGASLGQVTETAEATIRPSHKTNEYILYMQKEKVTFNDKEDALQYAEDHLRRQIEDSAERSGGEHVITTVSINPVYTQAFNSKKKTYIETQIKAFAVATPQILR